MNIESLKKRALRELAIFLGLLLFGLVILPMAIYWVCNSVFGDYGGSGFFAFYGTLQSAMRDAEPAALFLVLAPYLMCQLTRLTVWGFRQTWRRRQQIRG